MEVFSAREEDGVHIITMPMVMDHTNTHLFEKAKLDWLESECSVHVMDLVKVAAIMPSAHPSLVKFHKDLREKDKSLFSVHTPESLIPQLKRDGLFAIFNPVENLEVVHRLNEMKRAKKEESRSRLIAETINAFSSSIDEIFKTNFGLDPIAEPPYLKNVGDSFLFEIGMQNTFEIEYFQFSIVLQFDKKVFENVYDYFLDRDTQASPQEQFSSHIDLKRIVQKMLNPIFHLANQNLREKNRAPMKLNSSQILIGESLSLHKECSAIVVEFLTAAGTFRLEVAILK